MKTSAVLLLAVAVGIPVAAQSVLVSRGPANGRAVALTFDAGADRGFAGRILQTLERDRVHATFGMTGLWATRNPDLIRRMRRDGDAFMNHTFDHRSFTGFSSRTGPLTRAQRVWEISQTETVMRRLTGRSTKPYFRPPFGDYDNLTLSVVRELGYRYTVMWTVDSLGWERLSAQAILDRCVARITPGSIFLMHVGSQSQDAFALPGLLRALHRGHYRIVTVPQLLGSH